MTKEEEIKEAYGEHFEELKNDIGKNGWIGHALWMQFFKGVDVDYDEFDNRNMLVRPNSLKGIETNNGWIKINSCVDLPKESGQYFANVNSKIEVVFYHSGYRKWFA
jgi:hypothetical protein